MKKILFILFSSLVTQNTFAMSNCAKGISDVQKITNQTISLNDKKKKLIGIAQNDPRYKKMVFAAIGELYFKQANYKKAKTYFSKMNNSGGCKSFNDDLYKLEYATTLSQMGKEKGAAEIFETFKGSTAHLPKVVEEAYLSYLNINKTAKQLTSEINSAKNLITRPSIKVRVQFEKNSAQITPKGKQQINEIYRVMSKPTFKNLSYLLTGHTSLEGSENYNMNLSIKRANAVKMALINKSNNLSSYLRAEGKGETKPITKEINPIANKRNRRVEIMVLTE